MARNSQEIEKEIRRIEGQLLVAKQICRENLNVINQLKQQQENDLLLQETNRLLSLPSLDSLKHAEQFNKLLDLIAQEQSISLDTTVKYSEENSTTLIQDLSANITELERLFEYAKNLFTQPIQSVNMLNNTTSLQDLTVDQSIITLKEEHQPIDTHDLQNRIDIMRKKLHTSDDCSVQ